MYKFGRSSLEKLATVHEDLQRLANEVIKITPIDFTITEGIRTPKRQRELFERGKSKTMLSKHLDGKAFDFCPYINGKIDYEARDDLIFLCGLFFAKAKELGIAIRLGCIWNSKSVKENEFLDSYHIELR